MIYLKYLPDLFDLIYMFNISSQDLIYMSDPPGLDYDPFDLSDLDHDLSFRSVLSRSWYILSISPIYLI